MGSANASDILPLMWLSVLAGDLEHCHLKHLADNHFGIYQIIVNVLLVCIQNVIRAVNTHPIIASLFEFSDSVLDVNICIHTGAQLCPIAA